MTRSSDLYNLLDAWERRALAALHHGVGLDAETEAASARQAKQAFIAYDGARLFGPCTPPDDGA